MRILITKAGKIVLEDLEDLQESCPKTMNIIRHRNLTISHYDPMKNKRIPFQNNITISSLNDSNNLYNTTNIFQNRKKMMLNSDINTNKFIDNIINNNNIEITEVKPLKLGKNKINFPKNFADKYENETNNSVGNIISSNENFNQFLTSSSNNNISSSNNTLHSKLYSFKEIIPESSINTMKKLIINNRKEKEKHTRIDENNFRSSYEIQTDLEKFNDVINYPKINGNKTSKNLITEFSTKERKSEEINFTKIKEKINSWYINIYLISNKRKTITVINLNECFNAVKSRKFFSKLISQNYRTLFDIKENNQTFLGNEGFMEILEKIQFILSKLTYEEYETGKLLTLGCFKYYTFLEENKCSKYYLYNKYTELFSPCELWLNHIFWKTWFDEDISYIEKELNSTNSIDYSLELNSSSDKENELYEYQEENNNLSIEFRLLGKIFKIMTHLKLSDKFINKVIYDDLAENYLTEKELNSFKEDMA